MNTKEKKKFYVGVRPCGCVTATLRDDNDTTPKEIAEFARHMHKSGRRMEHMEITQEELIATFKPCHHKTQTTTARSQA